MKKLHFVVITYLSSMLLAPSVLAGTSEVTWTNPEKYRDIDPGDSHREKFKRQIFSNFEKHFAKLAKALPEGQVLKINVTDVDLAGDAKFNMERIRIVRDIYFPRLEFSYEVVDASGNTLHSGEENLKDMSFMMRGGAKYGNDLLSYEKRMLDDWFRDTFKS
ncbi:DUF3016 domain-containing protein [Thalassotalea marina]|uniref:DUF3016 domain-containing protein n=1 Tax=Thalassotalea marina TaxID=1673741 RepID=A0A919EP74_9GAMM|nr:DUF3016 domain-containing protein [Thalassotalea marina]GHG04469.1 hypothetical protein GCM10017161_37530 [Thalassotalea marina]